MRQDTTKYMICVVAIILLSVSIVIMLIAIYLLRKTCNLQQNEQRKGGDMEHEQSTPTAIPQHDYKQKYQENYHYPYWDKRERQAKRSFSHMMPLFGNKSSETNRSDSLIVGSSVLYAPSLFSPEIQAPEDPDNILSDDSESFNSTISP